MAKEDKAGIEQVESFETRKNSFLSWLKNNPDNSENQIFTKISSSILNELEYMTAHYDYGNGEIEVYIEEVSQYYNSNYIIEELQRVSLLILFFLKIQVEVYSVSQQSKRISISCWFDTDPYSGDENHS